MAKNEGLKEILKNATPLQRTVAAQYAGIPDMVSAQIDEYMAGDNLFVPKALLKAIESFPNEQEAFDAWREYFRTGDENEMKKFVGAQKFSAFQDLSLRQMFIKETKRAKGKKSGVFNNAVTRGVSNLLNWSLTPLLAKKISGLKIRNALFHGVFQKARHSIKSPAMENTPYKQVLAPHIEKAAWEKLVVDLDTLRRVAKGKEPLITLSPEEVKDLKDKASADTIRVYTEIVKQTQKSQHDGAHGRHELSLDGSQMPDDQDFGIELEGFLMSDLKFDKQVIEVWGDLLKYDIPVEKNPLKIIRDSMLPKIGKYHIWTVTRDASVLNPLTFLNQNNVKDKLKFAGMEVVSRILNGKEGGKEAHRVFQILRAMSPSFVTNDTCGMHLHVSLENTTLGQKKNLAEALVKNEAYIDQLVDENRRGEENPFAKSTDHVNIEDIRNAGTITELVEVMCPNGDRDHKFDFTNLDFPGAPPTIQYRCEGGEGYIHTGINFVVAMANFTVQAKDNPNITLNQVLENLGQPPIILKPGDGPETKTDLELKI